jgi:hypothetical protein
VCIISKDIDRFRGYAQIFNQNRRIIMADKLSWNPPKWKSYSFDGNNFKVELETGEIFKGKIRNFYIELENHVSACSKIFGTIFGNNAHKELSQVLGLKLTIGHWPEYPDVEEFIKRYYERVAKIGNSSTSKIYIETEFNITPKFTL